MYSTFYDVNVKFIRKVFKDDNFLYELRALFDPSPWYGYEFVRISIENRRGSLARLVFELIITKYSDDEKEIEFINAVEEPESNRPYRDIFDRVKIITDSIVSEFPSEEEYEKVMTLEDLKKIIKKIFGALNAQINKMIPRFLSISIGRWYVF
jgi:hypothetical protein